MIDRVAAEPGPRALPIGGARTGGPNEETTPPAAESGGASFTPSFRDLLSIVNPLQHLPIIGTIYRRLTGDTAHPVAQVLGGLLYGGPVGMFGAALNATVEQATGKNLTETAFALARGEMPATPPGVPTRDVPLPTLAQDLPAEPQAELDAPPTAIEPAANVQAPSIPAETPQPASVSRATPAPAGSARNLAFYQAHAGARLPPAASFSPGVTAAASAAPPVATPSLQSITQAAGTSQPTDGFNAAMLRGLERYKQAKRSEIAAPILDQME